jgi:hypothetical protein
VLFEHCEAGEHAGHLDLCLGVEILDDAVVADHERLIGCRVGPPVRGRTPSPARRRPLF